MEHLPAMSCPIPGDLKMKYLCDHDLTPSSGFWEYPEQHHWDREKIDVGLGGHNARVLMRSKTDSQMLSSQDLCQVARLLQGWWYFGLLGEFLQAEVKHMDFVTQDSQNEGRTVTTARLSEYLHDWESRLAAQEPTQALLQLRNSKRCVDFVYRQIENLGRFIDKSCSEPLDEGSKSSSALEKLLSLKDSIDEKSLRSHILPALLGEEHNFWARHGRKVLPENLELGICVLGATLSHAIHVVRARLDLGNEELLRNDGTAWYTPAIVHRRLIRQGVCPRILPALQPRLSIIGMCLASSLDHQAGGVIPHDGCSAKRCNVDYLTAGRSVRRHAAEACLCGDFPPHEFYEKVFCLLESGQIPVVLVKSEQGSINIQVLSSTETHYIAFSHVWSDGLGNQVANQLSTCQWVRLQSLVDDFFPSDPNGSVPFWLDTFCVPVVGKNERGILNTSDFVRRRNMRNYAIERMRDTYRNAYSVIILDSTTLQLEAGNLSKVEFGLVFSFTRWQQRLWTMHEGAVAPYGRVFVRTADGTVQLIDVFKGLQDMREKERSDRNVQLLSSIGIIEAYQGWMLNLHVDVSDPSNENLQHIFKFAWNESRNRATKYEEDRYVVIASLLGIGRPQDFYDCESDEARTQLLFERFNPQSIPAGALFTSGDRISTPGFRWAPSSIDHDRFETVDQLPAGKRTDQGLVVELPGWRLTPHPSWSRHHWVERPPTKASRCPMDSKTPGPNGVRSWLLQTKPDDAFHWLSLINPNQKVPCISEDDSLVIIKQPIRREAKNSDRAFLAAEKQQEEGGLIHVRYLATLWWDQLSGASQRKALLAAQHRVMDVCVSLPVGDGTSTPMWCVD